MYQEVFLSTVSILFKGAFLMVELCVIALLVLYSIFETCKAIRNDKDKDIWLRHWIVISCTFYISTFLSDPVEYVPYVFLAFIILVIPYNNYVLSDLLYSYSFKMIIGMTYKEFNNIFKKITYSIYKVLFLFYSNFVQLVVNNSNRDAFIETLDKCFEMIKKEKIKALSESMNNEEKKKKRQTTMEKQETPSPRNENNFVSEFTVSDDEVDESSPAPRLPPPNNHVHKTLGNSQADFYSYIPNQIPPSFKSSYI